jgi:hypothetical protein
MRRRRYVVMHGSTKVLVGGVACGVVAVLLGAIASAAFGDAEGGAADAFHFLQLGLLAAAVVLCAAGAVLVLARRVGTSGRTNA